jgi:hypothetical protein
MKFEIKANPIGLVFCLAWSSKDAVRKMAQLMVAKGSRSRFYVD